MLTTIIYRSHIEKRVTDSEVQEFIRLASPRNLGSQVSGILLFDGSHFLQLLEGPEENVQIIYDSICRDNRHFNIVELLKDYSLERHFGHHGMELFDLREHDKEYVLENVLACGTSKYKLTYHDRALHFIKSFVESKDKGIFLDNTNLDEWQMEICEEAENAIELKNDIESEYTFIFNPIVNPHSKSVTCYEAKLRMANGDWPAQYISMLSREDIYNLDIESKSLALTMAKELAIADRAIAIKLLPMSLVTVPDAVEKLLSYIDAQGFVPQQIMVLFSEDSVFSEGDDFIKQVTKLKRAGMRLAIENFGAGLAGLTMLANVQPEQIIIDADITQDIHRLGPKQAIVQAIVKVCHAMEISVVAAGISHLEEWLWLKHAGVNSFQGKLFSQTRMNTLPRLYWPVNKLTADVS